MYPVKILFNEAGCGSAIKQLGPHSRFYRNELGLGEATLKTEQLFINSLVTLALLR
jgi:hypothetical protein